ncbi:MAG: sialate O-acetylesterase [Glycocaulis sp.]
MFEDTAAGLVGTSEGNQFQVVDGDEVIRYRHDAGPVATEVARYPSTAVTQALRDDLDEVRAPLALYTGSDDMVPIYTDQQGRLLLGVNKTSGDLVGANIGDAHVDSVLGRGSLARYTGDGPIWPVVTDTDGRVLLGLDQASGDLIGTFTTSISVGGGGASSFPVEALADPITPAAYNHLLFYGQSLSVGAAAGVLLSTSQPYSNVTFNGGPRAWNGSAWDFGAFKPLVEDEVSPAPDGGTNRKETPCSGAANYASTRMAVDGVAPADHVILASTAGHGGYRINQLEKGTAWYPNLMAHVSGARALDTDHAVHALCWMQGENDIVSTTAYATYRAALAQLQADVQADVQAATLQTHPVYLLTYQVSYGATAHGDVALAQLDLAQKSDRFFLATPTYHIPHAADNVHLTAVGYKWIGAYFGRAYAEIAQGRKPRWRLHPGAGQKSVFASKCQPCRWCWTQRHLPLPQTTASASRMVASRRPSAASRWTAATW